MREGEESEKNFIIKEAEIIYEQYYLQNSRHSRVCTDLMEECREEEDNQLRQSLVPAPNSQWLVHVSSRTETGCKYYKPSYTVGTI